jgi:predicted RND superfamily exporter protein
VRVVKRLLTLAAAHPWTVFLVLLIVSLAASTQLHKVELHISPGSLTIEGDPAKQFYESSVATFGSDFITVVFIRDANLFDPGRLDAIRATVERLEALSFVVRTQSLFSVPHLQVVDDFVHTDPFLDKTPATREEAEHIRVAALQSPFVRRNLLSEDGAAMAINLYLQEVGDRVEFDAVAAAGIEKAIAPLAVEVDEVFQIGLPYVRTLVRDKVLQDQRTILPLAVAVLLVTLAVSLRRLNGALIPLLTASLSVLWTLGFMGALGIPMSVMTAIVPVLLIIVGSTEDVHLISEYYEGTVAGIGRRAAIARMARRMGLAVLLTFLTTYFGFLSIAVNPIGILRDFGLVSSTGLFFNFAITVALVPAYLRLFGDRHPASRVGKKRPVHDAMVDVITRTAMNGRKWILLISASAIVISAYGAVSLRVNNNIFDYFDKGSPVRQRAEILHEELSGLKTFSIVVDGRIDGTFQRVRYLEELQEIEQYLANSPDVDFSVSLADYLALVNGAMNESPAPELPEDDDVLREISIFVAHRNVKEYVSADYSRANIVVRHNLASSYDLKRALQNLHQFVRDKTDEDLDVRVTGESILTSRAADQMAGGQGKSLFLMTLVIFTIISLLFVNVRVGLLAILPNTFPVVVLFGVMGYAGIPLDTGTAMVSAIALGICVDNTMHFMVRYNRELKGSPNEEGAIAATLRHEVTPIAATSAALALGLGTMAFSSFGPVASFGTLSAIVMLVAFFADFFITPILLSTTRLITIWDLLSLRLRRELTRNCALFRGMRPGQIKRVILMGQVHAYKAGDAIMRQGEVGREMFILLEGSGEISTIKPGAGVDTVRTLGPGHVFGIVALVCGRTRISTVVALEDTRVLSLTWEGVRRTARFYPRSANHLFGNIAAIIGDRFAEKVLGVTPELVFAAEESTLDGGAPCAAADEEQLG